MAWARTYDIDTPDGSVDNPAEAADRMQEIKYATQERLDVDHYVPLTGSEVSDLEAGEHRKLTLRTLTAVAVAALTATKAYLYRLVTDGELYFKDDDDNTIKLTSGGKILSASLDMKDEDDMASDSDTHAATQQSIKAYADAAAAAAAAAAVAAALPDDDAFGAWLARANNTSYLAASDGFVCAMATGVNTVVKGYTDGANPPTTLRLRDMTGTAAAHGSYDASITLPVKKGDYWKVTGASTVYWMPLGG